MPLSKIQLKSASRNLIINGDFRIWQRGTSHTSTSTNEYSADRFRTEGNVLSTTISRQAFTTGQTDVPNFPTYYTRVATSAKPSSGQYWAFMQRIEAPLNARQGQTYTLSYWVRSTSGTVAASAFTYGFGGSGASRSNSPALTTTWQKVTNTFTSANMSGGGAYLSVYIMRVPDTAPSSMSVEIANVKVEEGHIATDFEHRPFGEELALCERYFQTYSNRLWQGTNEHAANYQMYFDGVFRQKMRATPTAAIIGLVTIARPQVAVTQRPTSILGLSNEGFTKAGWATSGTYGGQLGSHGDAYYRMNVGAGPTNRIDFSAEL